MFEVMISMLEQVHDDGLSDQRGVTCGLLFLVQQFDFTFNLHLMGLGSINDERLVTNITKK